MVTRGLQFAVVVAIFACCTCALSAAEIPLVRSQKSGPWSEKQTWDGGRIPKTGDRVVVRTGHHVTYDVDSKDVIRLVQVAGTLDFAKDRNTRLEVGLLTVLPVESPTEEGFDCHVVPEAPQPGVSPPALIVGRPEAPIVKGCTALIRLHLVEGLDKESCPAIICCGGRMEFHGQKLTNTWVKMKAEANAGDTEVSVVASVKDWTPGDLVIVAGTKRPRNGLKVGGEYYSTIQTEERRVESVEENGDSIKLRLDKPLTFPHYAQGNYCAEVANLSRNVIVESADPSGERGHTMYHRYSSGSVSYAEFRHLGKKDKLGRYSMHYHLAGDTMRGSSVIGASIWDSENRWLVIHGTSYLTVRDCVGYKSTGHGFFLEDGTENFNVLDHNLAVAVAGGKPLPKQVLPYDPNRGAGFWWANCQNSFTRNVAADCIEYGYRFDNKQTPDFDPHLKVLQPDGSYQSTDTRILPFIRFEDNEAHSMKFFSLSLRGATRPDNGLDVTAQAAELARDAALAIPEKGHPFWIRNFKTWEAHWGTYIGTAGVFVDGYECFRTDVGIFRSIMEGSGFRRLTMTEMRVNDIHVPVAMAVESSSPRSQGGVSSFRDDQPPVTMITRAIRDGNVIRLSGSTADSSDVVSVKVNDKLATSVRAAFAEWEITLDAPPPGPTTISAFAQDSAGHVEPRPHVIVIP
jgi:hypothetical protein